METEIRYYYSKDSKNEIIDFLKTFNDLSFEGRNYEITDQYNHPMKEYDFYSKEIDGRFRVRKTDNGKDSKCMISWKRRLKDNTKELIHQEEEIELTIKPEEYDNLCLLLKNVLHLDLVESYERYRNVFKSKDIEIDLDEYPFGICLEIESKSNEISPEENIKNWLKKLHLDINKAYRLSWDDKYSEICKEQGLKVKNIVRFSEEMPQIDNKFYQE